MLVNFHWMIYQKVNKKKYKQKDRLKKKKYTKDQQVMIILKNNYLYFLTSSVKILHQ